MKLLKLYSDNQNFKTIKFLPGLNIIVGLQSSKSSTDSFNGIGKSSSLQLLHLMFGGSFKPKVSSDQKLKIFLSSYGDFYLDFLVGKTPYQIRKNFSKNDFFLNEEKISQTAFPKKMKEILLLDTKVDVTFKALFNMFARRYLPERSYYAGALTQQARQPEDYYQMLYNLTLLGIGTDLVKRNQIITDKLSGLKKTEEILNKQKLTINEKDYLDLKDELDRLVHAKENFIIAKNYDVLKRTADELTLSLEGFRNKIFSNERDIKKKRSILQAIKSSDINISKVIDIYNEAEFHFQDEISKRLEQAEQFHKRIQRAREVRLYDRVSVLEAETAVLISDLEDVESKRDKLLKDLDASGALEEYNSIVERIRVIDADIAELTSYQTVLSKFEKDKASLELKKAKIKAESIGFLEENKSLLNDVEVKFRKLVKKFYSGHGGSLKVTNSKNAKYLYDIEVYIPQDGSQGINEVKIFCYDILLYTLNPSLLGFLAHDSFIFSGVDPRQIATMFKVVMETVREKDLQYFININKNDYENLLSYENEGSDEILTLDERTIISESTILELYDSNSKNKLFGEAFG